jgi:hypothetical protein
MHAELLEYSLKGYFLIGVEWSTIGGTLLAGDASVRKQFVLDERSDKLLEELASYRGGNRSLVIREAIQEYADMEERLDKIEADPRGFST